MIANRLEELEKHQAASGEQLAKVQEQYHAGMSSLQALHRRIQETAPELYTLLVQISDGNRAHSGCKECQQVTALARSVIEKIHGPVI